MCKGLPASGKSTWAKEFVEANKGWKRINKDELRLMLDNSNWSKQNEKFVLDTRDYLVRQALSTGFNVIVDDTNLNPKHEKDLKAIASELNCEFETKDFTNVPLYICLDRDKKRENSVGQKVILDMFNQYLKPKVEHNFNLENCIICDLDGTLANFEGNPYDRDFSKDVVNRAVSVVLDFTTRYECNIPIIFFSGRNDKFINQTKQWLKYNGFNSYELYMRKDGDNRSDRIVKKEMFDVHVKNKYNVLFCMDDRDAIVSLWRELGLTCFQVNYGDF
jgi:predicted kinase